MSSTVGGLIDRCRTEYLLAGSAERRNVLDGAINDSTTSVILTYDTTGIGPNHRISVGFEDMHVYAVNGGAKTLTVSRGDYDTTAASHSDGDVVHVGQPWSNHQILRTMNDVAMELSGRGLFQVPTPLELTFQHGTDAYDLTGATNLIEVLEVETKAHNNTDWHRLDVSQWRTVHQAETDDFASGKALVLHNNGLVYSGKQLRVWYRSEIGTLSADTTANAITETGLESSAVDLLPLGAAVRLLAGQPSLRNNLHFQPDPRRAEDVPAGATLASATNLRRIFEQRVDGEIMRMNRKYPVRLRGAR